MRVIKNRRQIKHTIFAYFLLNFVNFVPIDLKIGTHIDWTYNMYHTKNCTNKNNVTRISKYPIIKDRPISDTHNVHFRDGRRLISLVVNLLNCQIYIITPTTLLVVNAFTTNTSWPQAVRFESLMLYNKCFDGLCDYVLCNTNSVCCMALIGTRNG